MAEENNKYRLTEFLRQWLKRLDSSRDQRIQSLKESQEQYYREFLESLACTGSSDMFSNGGKIYASILMSVLFQHTENKARIYSIGFRPELITTDPYWTSLKRWLANPMHELKVLVDSDEFINMEPLKLLKKIKDDRSKQDLVNTIIVKRINKESKNEIIQKYGEPCNFAIFDNNKFRYEYDPVNFKAYGSFNQPETCRILIEEFDQAFEASNSILI